MEKFRILLVPANDEEEHYYEMDVNCKDVLAAKDQASVYLAMAGQKYRSAIVISQWKSSCSWRQATDRICNNFNL